MTQFRDKRIWAGAGVLLAGVLVFLNTLTGEDLAGVPTLKLTRATFQVTLFENGEIRAAKGEKVATPEVGGRLKITNLWPEGQKVEVGDLLLQFDKAQFEKNLRDTEGELEKVKADLEKGQVSQEQQLSDLETGIIQQEASLELAKLTLKMQEYGTPLEKEQAQIGLEQTQRAVEQAHKDFEVRKLVNRVEMAKLQLTIAQTQKNYDRVKKEYEQLDVRATRPGIVVYEKINKGGGRKEKVKVGDQPWGGQTLLTLPDLDAMQVLSQVGEMDVQQVQPGQPVLVRLDAFPGPVFHGQVAKVAPMANPEEDAPNVQVFELVVDIKEQDDRLRPGMSAAIEIVVDTLANALSVPLEALHLQDGQALAYRLRGGDLEPVKIRLGLRNTVAAVVDSGLDEGEVIALRPPVQKEE